MKHRSSAYLLALPLVFQVLAAGGCFSSDNAPGLPDADLPDVDIDASVPGLDATLPPVDATMPLDGSDGGALIDQSTPSDGGSPGDAFDGAVPDALASLDTGAGDGSATAPCSAPVRVDLGSEVVAPLITAAVANGSTYAAIWQSSYRAETDSRSHLRARIMNGLDSGEIDLGGAGSYPYVGFTADPTGRGFAQWFGADGGERSVFDFTTFAPATPFGLMYPYTAVDLAPLAPAGAISIYAPDASLIADKWTPDAGAWTATGLSAPTGATVTLTANATGQAVASWGNAGSAGGTNPYIVNVTTYNGSAWSPVVTVTLGADAGAGGAPYNHTHVTLSNGDAVFFFFYIDSIEAMTFSASSGQFQAPVTVLAPGQGQLYFSTPPPPARHWVAIDPSDRITLVWPSYGDAGPVTELFASRNLGSGWSAPVDLGPTQANDDKLAVGPGGEVVVATINGTGPWIRGISATGTTWTPLAYPPFADLGGGMHADAINGTGAMVFTDATHVVLVEAQRTNPSSNTYGLFATTCAL